MCMQPVQTISPAFKYWPQVNNVMDLLFIQKIENCITIATQKEISIDMIIGNGELAKTTASNTAII